MRRYRRDWHDGRIKLAVIATLLAFRRDHAGVFADGTYEPMSAAGPRADEIVAFQRRQNDPAMSIVVAVRRFPGRHEAAGHSSNADAVLDAMSAGATGWRDLLTGRAFPRGAALHASAIFAVLPAAVLVSEP